MTRTHLLLLNAALVAWLAHSCSTDRMQSAVARPGGDGGVKAPAESDKRPATAVADLRHAFSDVAEGALPSVVTILSTQDVKSPFGGGGSPGGHPFGGHPFFEHFFGGPPGPEGAPGGGFKRHGLGSGVIVRADGTVLTNHHVVKDADDLQVRLHDGRELPAKVVGSDSRADVAVIRIQEGEGFTAARLGDSEALRVGEWILCIGSPLRPELGHTVTAGIVSAKGRSHVGLTDYEDFIQTDAAINQGNSGGPMLNLDGEVVGINTAIATSTGGHVGIGFSVPSNLAKGIMEQLIAHGKVRRGWLGVLIQEVSEELAEGLSLPDSHGALVGDVVPDSPAAKAGLQVGDVIRSVAGKEAKDVPDVRNRIAHTPPGTALELRVLREGEERTVTVTIGELADEGGKGVSATGEATQGGVDKLGLRLRTLTPELRERHSLPEGTKGVLVSDVDRDGLAARAGLRPGDALLTVNREPVAAPADVERILAAAKPGRPVLFRVQREEASMFVALRLPKAGE